MISLGDTLPQMNVKVLGDNGLADFHTSALCDGKVILFGVPGAFTPTCTAASLPSFVVHGDTLREHGVDRIACVAVNDAFTMRAWGESANAEGIDMLADWNADFCRAMGLTLDLSGAGLGERAKRFTLVLQDGIVETCLVEDNAGTAENTSADALLAQW